MMERCCVYSTGTPFTHVCCSLSGWDAFLWFMRSGLSHGMLQPAAFKNAKRWGVYTVWASPVASRLSFQSSFSTDGRMGLSLSRQWGRGALLGALHAYQWFQPPWGDLLSLDYSTDPTAKLVMMVCILYWDIWQRIHTSRTALFNKLTWSLFCKTANWSNVFLVDFHLLFTCWVIDCLCT